MSLCLIKNSANTWSGTRYRTLRGKRARRPFQGNDNEFIYSFVCMQSARISLRCLLLLFLMTQTVLLGFKGFHKAKLILTGKGLWLLNQDLCFGESMGTVFSISIWYQGMGYRVMFDLGPSWDAEYSVSRCVCLVLNSSDCLAVPGLRWNTIFKLNIKTNPKQSNKTNKKPQPTNQPPTKTWEHFISASNSASLHLVSHSLFIIIEKSITWFICC